MAELWRPVVGWDGLYDVSNTGRVRSLKRNCSGAQGTSPGKTGRVLTPGVHEGGYLTVMLYRNRKYRAAYVHHLVLEAFVGPCPPGMECRHFPDRDPTNNNAENLSWGTPEENASDKKLHNTNPQGERNGHAKVDENDVRAIRRMYATGDYTMRRLGTIYDLSVTAIHDIIHGINWSHVPNDLSQSEVTYHG